MIRESYQFGSFDGLDNRKSIMDLFVRFADGKSEEQARQNRAIFLTRLIKLSGNGFAATLPQIKPCSAVEGYLFFTAICGQLGVPIERGARQLEDYIRRQL